MAEPFHWRIAWQKQKKEWDTLVPFLVMLIATIVYLWGQDMIAYWLMACAQGMLLAQALHSLANHQGPP